MTNLLTAAVQNADLDAALKSIMDALGIETGDVAGAFFNDVAAAEYRTAFRDRRAEMLRPWLCAELAYAAAPLICAADENGQPNLRTR